LTIKEAEDLIKWIFPQYKAGLDGFDTWIRAVKTGTSIQMGMAYNAAVWQVCRGFGVDFLQEAKERLDGGMGALFDQAIGHYKAVAGHLKTVTELYPFKQGLSEDPIGIDDKSHAAVASLEKAREAEAAGLQSLTKIVTQLGGITPH
jgi:hypothetical protein